MKKVLLIGTVTILLAGQAFSADSNEAYKAYLAKYASEHPDENISISSDTNISAPVAATIPAGQTTCKKASDKHKASMFTGGGTGNGVTGIAVKGAIMLSAFIYNKVIDYVEEDCVTSNTNADEVTTLRDEHTKKMNEWSRAMTARDDIQNDLKKETDPQKKELLAAKLAKLEIEVQETSKQEVEAETAVNTYLAQNQK